jgi:mRNA interferase MazF
MRGEIYLAALPGDLGKPRPWVVVQGPAGDRLPAVVLCPLTSFAREDVPEFRPTVLPTSANGLRAKSQVMTDKPSTVDRRKLHGPIGRLTSDEMNEVSVALAVLLGPA